MRKFLVVIIAVTCISFQIDEGRVYWAERRQLKFSDFKGGDATLKKLLDAEASCSGQIFTDFKFNNHQLSYTVSAYFAEDFSFMSVRDSQLLVHEQGHFDITEVIARKFRQTLNTRIHYLSEADTLAGMINALSSYQDDLNERYDGETAHGAKREKQNEWNVTIQKMLDSLNDYQNTSGIIILK